MARALLVAAVALAVLQLGLSTVQNHRALESAEALRHGGALVLQTRPAGAEATLDGRSLGRTPLVLPRDLAAKPGTLRLAAPGYAGELELGDWTALHQTLGSTVPLHATTPGVSQVLHAPAGALAVLLGLAGGLLTLRKPALPEPGDFVGPGGRVGDYALEEEIGRGSMAEVYLARPMADPRRRLAVKVLHPEVGENEEFRRRFAREVAICRTMEHPGILRVHDTGEAWGRLYLVMDHVPGPSLRSQIPPAGMDPDRATALVRALAGALAYAHAQGVVHRDLKPENVLMTADGRPLLADFGMARGESYETLTATDATLGTPAYMPPEQVTGVRSDRRADLYSLGCLYYELLTGAPPFQGDAMAVIMQHMGDEPEPPSRRRPGLPAKLDGVILRLLQKDPADRYPDAEALLKDLVG